MITPDLKASFETQGLIRLDRLLPIEMIERARDVVLQCLERTGLWQDAAWCVDQFPQSTAPNAGASLVKGTKRSPAFADLKSPELLDDISILLDRQSVCPMMECAQLLFTLPNASSWTVPYSIWHLDVPRLANTGIPGVQMFTFLDSVAPGGGGTLVVAGSHRLMNTDRRTSSKMVKRFLKRDPYFRDLMSKSCLDRERFIHETGCVDGVEVQVVELCGNPGDVYLMDMRLLHTLAPNTTCVPRMMATQRYLLESLYEEVFGAGNQPMELE